ncbi:MAG: hypothetical protein HY518_03495 [Candidatus Aenigmarchaeota archaeon]|nr:hypothetical protein [Candidatus Aenigmarchaeota archaeon]
MRESENGILVRPQLLIPDAFVDPDMFGGMGNPITSLPRDALENLL